MVRALLVLLFVVAIGQRSRSCGSSAARGSGSNKIIIQCNLPRVLSVLVLKIASCLIPYIDSFLILNEEWSSFLFKDFPKVVFYSQNIQVHF